MNFFDHDNKPELDAGFFTLCAFRICGVIYSIIKKVPQDWDDVRGTALLIVLVMLYQWGILTLVGIQVTDAHGIMIAVVVVASGFVAAFIAFTDVVLVVRGSWFKQGIERCRSAGLLLEVDAMARASYRVSLTIRILLACCLSLACGEIAATEIFHSDVAQVIDQKYVDQNRALFTTVTGRVDQEITRGAAEVAAQSARIAVTSDQLSAVHAKIVSPGSSDPRLLAAQDQLKQAIADKQKADADLGAAQRQSSAELAGIKSATTTGVQGRGPARRAMEELVAAAEVAEQAAATALAQAHDHFDSISKEVTEAPTNTTQSQEEANALTDELVAERSQLATLQQALATANEGRDQEIRAAMENAPDQIRRDEGLIAQLEAVRTLASDPEVLGLTVLITLASMGLELAAVLAKVAAFAPTLYSALLVREHYLALLPLVDDIDAAFRRANPGQGTPFTPPVGPKPDMPGPSGSATDLTYPNGPSAKRPRGRPRKTEEV